MNIQAQVCGVILLVIMIMFYAKYKSLRLGTQIAFQILMSGMLLCIFFDMLSIWAIVRIMKEHRLLVYAICKTYLMTIVLVALLGFLYECADVYGGQKKYWKIVAIGCGAFFVECIVIASLSLGVYRMGRVVYTAGPSVLSTYVFAGSFILSNVIFTVRKRKQGNPRRTQVILLWMGLWSAAAVTQFLNNELLLVGYAGAMGVLIIFFRLENPEYLTDRVTGMYNHDALLLYAKKLYNTKKTFSVMSVWWMMRAVCANWSA